MRIGSLLLPVLAIAAILIAAIACDTGESSLSASDLAALTQYNQGIRVTGTGTVSVAPDVATLRMGVETTAETADEARSQAASAMDAIMGVLRARGIEGQRRTDHPVQHRAGVPPTRSRITWRASLPLWQSWERSSQ